MTTAASLRTYLIQQRRPRVTDGFLEETGEWTNLGGLDAEVLPQGAGDEVFDQRQMKAIKRFKIKVRFGLAVQPDDRLFEPVEKVSYNVETSCDPDGKRRFLEITATQWQKSST